MKPKSFLLPSQKEALDIIDSLTHIENTGQIPSSAFANESPHSSACIWLMSQLSEAGLVNQPTYYRGSLKKDEFFDYIERNNLMAEESLLQIANSDSRFYESAKEKLNEYATPILLPKEIRLKTKVTIDEIFLDNSIGSEDSEDFEAPSAFAWLWKDICLLVMPMEADITKTKSLIKEMLSYNLQPTASITAKYSNIPSQDIDDYFGVELWHSLSQDPRPLQWEERNSLLNLTRGEYNQEKQNKAISINI